MFPERKPAIVSAVPCCSSFLFACTQTRIVDENITHLQAKETQKQEGTKAHSLEEDQPQELILARHFHLSSVHLCQRSVVAMN